MNLENQVCTINQAFELKKLGIVGKSVFFYVSDIPNSTTGLELVISFGYSWDAFPCYAAYPTKIPAFTLSELGQMLDSETYTQRTGSENSEYANWEWVYDGDCIADGPFNTEVEARAAMLIALLSGGSISAEICNKRLSQ